MLSKVFATLEYKVQQQQLNKYDFLCNYNAHTMESETSDYIKIAVLDSVSLLQETLLQKVYTNAIKYTITQALLIFEI